MQYVTAAQLKAFGWKDTSKEEVDRINAALIKYNITDKDSIILFMATVAAESDYGFYVLEAGDASYFADKSYTINDRGVGYIQLTHRDAQLDFLSIMEDEFTDQKTAEHIANIYDPWMVSAYVWTEMQFGEEVKMNEYSNKHGATSEVFLVTQFFINGWPEGGDSDLRGIREGSLKYNIDNNTGTLNVNGHAYNLPNGWKKREEAYNNAKKAFK